ncbi:MAG TPA: hypothetical protein VK752_06065 [Bryobacteraceae bacterium]|jgi:hypothetical protein|nr:hypothetical protein [Bryobacteraceae bacterium]
MKPLTKERVTEVFEAAFPGVKVEPDCNRWTLTLPWGRAVTITDKRIHLNGILELLPGEREEDREQLQFELMSFAEESFGCVDLRSTPVLERCRLAGYAKAYGLTVDENSFRPFGITVAKDFFGDEAEVNNHRSGGWRITLPDGKRVIIALSGGKMCITEANEALWEPALTMLSNLQGKAIIRGTYSFCMVGLLQAERLSIKAIPEVTVSFLATCLIANLAQMLVFLPAFVATQSFTWSFLGSWLVGSAVMIFVIPWRKIGRKRGQSLINKFASGANTRRAQIDDARMRGML